MNTANRRAGTDLAGPQALLDWLVLWGLVLPEDRLTAADLERVVAVREALRATLRPNLGAKLNDETVARLDAALAEVPMRLRFGSGGRACLEPIGAGLDGVLGRIGSIVAASQFDGIWPRLKSCAEPTCQRAFYDFSRSHSAKWCLSGCGSRLSSLAYRRRNLKEVRKMDRVYSMARR